MTCFVSASTCCLFWFDNCDAFCPVQHCADLLFLDIIDVLFFYVCVGHWLGGWWVLAGGVRLGHALSSTMFVWREWARSGDAWSCAIVAVHHPPAAPGRVYLAGRKGRDAFAWFKMQATSVRQREEIPVQYHGHLLVMKYKQMSEVEETLWGCEFKICGWLIIVVLLDTLLY